jgi:hypothetical protein
MRAQVTFADLASTAKSVTFAHAAGPGLAWASLGTMALRAHGDSRLQHVIKFGAGTTLQRYLRITFAGALLPPGSGGRCMACFCACTCAGRDSAVRGGKACMHASECGTACRISPALLSCYPPHKAGICRVTREGLHACALMCF